MNSLKFSDKFFWEKLKDFQPEIKKENCEIQWKDPMGNKVAGCYYQIVGVLYHHFGEPTKFVDWTSKEKIFNIDEEAAWEKALELQKKYFKDAIFLIEDLTDIHYWFYAVHHFDENGEPATFIPPTMEEKKDRLVELFQAVVNSYKEDFKYETEKVYFQDNLQTFQQSFNAFLEEYQGYDVCMFANYVEDKGIMKFKEALDFLMKFTQLSC
ncbi:MAG: hypothetical protein NZ521_04710 [Flammeovirgaceae bacterium]|nr:hypothetical protein [Flammeovirgaceae bacterium]MDW8287522.1 hypothetical protein [Flammeovirgaceae bacterium]